MTDKTYYQAAAAEVAQGCIDKALWIKVSADLPAAEPRVKQAKYIQLRAQELAAESVGHRALGFVRRIPRWVRWPAYAGLAWCALLLVVAVVDAVFGPRGY